MEASQRLDQAGIERALVKSCGEVIEVRAACEGGLLP
jgi:hypothetical protein